MICSWVWNNQRLSRERNWWQDRLPNLCLLGVSVVIMKMEMWTRMPACVSVHPRRVRTSSIFEPFANPLQELYFWGTQMEKTSDWRLYRPSKLQMVFEEASIPEQSIFPISLRYLCLTHKNSNITSLVWRLDRVPFRKVTGSIRIVWADVVHILGPVTNPTMIVVYFEDGATQIWALVFKYRVHVLKAGFWSSGEGSVHEPPAQGRAIPKKTHNRG